MTSSGSSGTPWKAGRSHLRRYRSRCDFRGLLKIRDRCRLAPDTWHRKSRDHGTRNMFFHLSRCRCRYSRRPRRRFCESRRPDRSYAPGGGPVPRQTCPWRDQRSLWWLRTCRDSLDPRQTDSPAIRVRHCRQGPCGRNCGVLGLATDQNAPTQNPMHRCCCQ